MDRKKRILLLEADLDLLLTLREGLEEAGFAVDALSDGDEAARKSRITRFDALVVDLANREEDPFGVTMEIKESPLNADIPAVGLVSAGDALTEKMAEMSGIGALVCRERTGIEGIAAKIRETAVDGEKAPL